MAELKPFEGSIVNEVNSKATSDTFQKFTEAKTIAERERSAQPATMEAVDFTPEMEALEFKEDKRFTWQDREPTEGVTQISKKEYQGEWGLEVDEYNARIAKDLGFFQDAPGGAEFDADNTGWQNVPYNLKAEWDDKGKIGFFESIDKFDKWGMVPFAGDIKETGRLIEVKGIIDKVNAKKILTIDEENTIREFTRDMQEVNYRGVSLGGQFIGSAMAAPAFVGEFLATTGMVYLTGGLAAPVAGAVLGKKVTVKAAKKGIKKWMKGSLKKKLAKGALMAAGMGSVRTLYNPININKNYNARKLNDSVGITDEGIVFFREGKESPTKTFLKAIGDTWVEQTSEVSGGYIFAPVAGKIASSMPKEFTKKFLNATVREGSEMTVRKMMKATGYNGFLEEMSEEALGRLMRFALDIDAEEGYSLDELGEALLPGWDQLLIEVGVIALQGKVTRSTGEMFNKVASSVKPKTTAEKEELVKTIDSLTETQRRSFLEQVKSQETEIEAEEYEKQKDYVYNQMARARNEKEASATMGMIDTFVTVKSAQTGISRTELMKEMPLVAKFDKAPEGALGQEEIKVYHQSQSKSQFGEFLQKGDAGYKKASYSQAGEGIYFSTDKELVKSKYGQSGGTLIEATISSKKMLDLKENDAMYFDGKMVNYGDVVVDNFKREMKGEKQVPEPDIILTNISKKAKNWLINNGYDSVTGMKGEMFSAPEVVVLDKSIINKQPLYQGKQGFYDKVDNLLGILPTANESTLVHEFAHVFFEMSLKHTPGELKVAFESAGIPYTSDISGEAYRRVQEVFARQFEVYVAEGKAPNAKLAEIFETFKEWMIKVYDNLDTIMVNAGFDFKLSDDVRNMFDKMLDMDQEITIDKDMATPAPTAVGVLYQSTKERISKLRRDRARALKKYGSKKKADLKEVDQLLKELEADVATEKELTELEEKYKETIDKIKEDFKAKSPTQLQKEVIKTIRNMDIDRADKVNFLGRIQKAKTVNSQRKVLLDMLDMERKYWEKRQRKILDKAIQKIVKQKIVTKQGGVSKGKFNFEDNEFFIELKRINKLNKEDAMKEAQYFEDEVDDAPDQKELALRQFTMYKAFGKSKGSVELFEVVHDSLSKMMKIASNAKDEADFNARVNKNKKIEELADTIDEMKFKGDAKSLTTKILNLYRNHPANFYSVINSIAGKEMADRLNPEVAESKRMTKIFEQMDATVEDAMSIFGYKNRYEFDKMIDQFSQEEYKIKEVFVRHEGRKHAKPVIRTFNRMGIIDIYNTIKNDQKKDQMYEAYGEDVITSLVNKLTVKEKEFADMLQHRVQSYREAVNKKHIEQTGIAMGNIENYWMATSVAPKDTLLDNMRVNGSMPSMVKSRSSWAIPKPADAWLKYTKHVAQAEHVVNLQDSWRELRKLFDSETIKSLVTEKYGKNVYQTILDQIDMISLNQVVTDTTELDSALGKVLNNWVKAKISLNPSVFVKQLISVGNYIEDMPIVEWNKGFVDGVSSPKKTIEYMLNASPYLKARYGSGYSETLGKALSEAKKIAKNRKITDVLTSMVRMGDVGAIIFGGYPVVKHLQTEEGGGHTLEEAVKIFEQRTIRSQQSGLKSSLSKMQSSKNVFNRMMFAFKNTPLQYLRKMADAQFALMNGDISKAQYAKTMYIYGVVQPMLFGLVTQGVRSLLYGDDDDYLDDVILAMGTSWSNGLPIINEFNKIMTQYMMHYALGEKKPFYGASTPVLDDVIDWGRAIGNLPEGDLDFFEYLELMETPVEISTGMPIKTFTRIAKKRLK